MWNEKDWLALTFFPIEDLKELEEMRKLRSEFMVNISKCFRTCKLDKDKMKEICEQIIKTVSFHRLDTDLQAKMEHIIFQNNSNETLKIEHEALVQFNME